jgi:15,16-dihydrobiliverdin:ferredoxin oxidoreductase
MSHRPVSYGQQNKKIASPQVLAASSHISMDMEQPDSFYVRPQRTRLFNQHPTRITPPPMTVDQAETTREMPWQSSIDPACEHKSLFYMPFWKWQLSFMKEQLTNLRVIPTVDRTFKKDLAYVENTKRKKRMITLCFSSDEYRLIRMTLLDAGQQTQVFTSLWYPRSNLPILGVDFLQFCNQTRHLTVVDFQPIHKKEEEHDVLYENLLEPIRQAYPSLQHKMTDRFYDENQFFSSQMLLGRDATPGYVWSELMPAWQAYVRTHVDMVKNNHSPKMQASKVLEHHTAYDDYSAERDPAHGLLASTFGNDYADSFVYDVLFPLSKDMGRQG